MSLQSGDFSAAEKNLEQVIVIRRLTGDVYSEGADYGNFSVALLKLGKKAEARTYALKAKAVFERVGEPGLVRQVEQLIAACEE